ncbi:MULTISPECIES: DEAD/DEAH box helicase family protein [Clostridia]|jgi:superfamily II DNA or RNA helicase|uniref:Type III restriction protein res subunit n=1 Tax=Pseudobacteroides cellulosolvens ATCC 35603 = DSM 2933 TaxID=398512 RepID=A0A0L6JPX6_9FIRM|nr:MULTISPECIES: DEAD/DEAH box helicase family protein [Clostridia]KNY27730.1 type III restriction protein res subunit [Pseudobacteroides cellulosolvens ATCC 35603 = DSM 2933]
MSLQDIEIKSEYRSLLDNVAKDFYIPLLQQAVSYKRAVGFFSSSALVEISKGISALVKNGGKILLVASPYLSAEDVEAIRKGYELRDNIIKKALVRELKEAKDVYEKDRLNLLANLISDGILDIKIAFTEDENKMGMYHEKMGIISDDFGNKVAFSGSMNESAAAMTLNYETIDVFCSWKGEQDRVAAKENAFASIWNDCEPNIRIIDFPNLKQEIIDRYKKATPNYDIDKHEFGERIYVLEEATKYRLGPDIPRNVQLHDYQIKAIDEWEKRDYRGIFDMATGTGKTFTGLGAIARLSERVSDKLAVIIVCPYQHLVEQWVEDIVKFNMNPIIGYSASSQKDWKRRLEDAIRDQKLKVRNKEFFCFICTNATFSSDFVQTQINKIRGNALLVVDEAHNFGAEYLSKLLSEKFTYRLALSATLERHNDEEGTAKLFSYFGEKCIEYSLDRAIEEKKLTRYKYYPIIVTLNDDELRRYSELTYEIGKCLIKGKNGKVKLSEKGKILALARARLVAGAEDKITKLEEYIRPYLHDRHILVYCGATKLLRENQDFTTVDDEDLRQIDVVTDLLGNKLNMKVSQFTSKEDVEEREILKREFADGDTLQALIAIKCLDEGVNIPKIKVAFILASTTNPKEYIQRRGRVLRLAEGKEYAEIYDFIALPRPLDDVPSLTVEQMKKELSLVKNELCRAEEFARIAMNMVEAESVLDEIKEAYSINDNLITFEEDFDYGQ